MNRRNFLIAAAAFTLLSTTAARADYVEDVVEWLTAQGYSNIQVTRTLLGRVKIVAAKGSGYREMICNPRTGEILRDIWIDGNGEVHPPTVTSDSSGSSGSGSDDAHDDSGDQDDKNDEGEDDNSGHGGDDSDDDDDGGRGKD